MRTTIDLRPDLHARAVSIARDKHQTLSETINDLISDVLDGKRSAKLQRRAVGITTISVGRPMTAEDVRSLDDE